MPGERIVCVDGPQSSNCEFNHRLNMKTENISMQLKEWQYHWLCLGDLSSSFLWTAAPPPPPPPQEPHCTGEPTALLEVCYWKVGRKTEEGKPSTKQVFLHVRQQGGDGLKRKATLSLPPPHPTPSAPTPTPTTLNLLLPHHMLGATLTWNWN